MPFDIGPIDGGGRGARRLLALAAYLETVADEDYDQRAWRRRRDDGAWTMCALGHGVSALPDLIGLRWRNGDGTAIVRTDGSGLTEDAITLAAEAFELSLDEAATLFGIGTRARALCGANGVRGDPRAVAAAIRRLAMARLSILA